MNRTVFLVGVIIAAAIVAVLFVGLGKNPAEIRSPLVGKPAPVFALREVGTNRTVDITQYRGKPLVVNFWATWCAPCLKEMPELSALDAMREDVSVVGLAYEEIDVPAMQAFLAKRPVVYPIAIVDTYDPPAAFDTPRGLPMTYLVAPDGTVARQFLGPVTAHQIEEAIAAAGGPAPGDPVRPGEAAPGA